MTFYRNIIYYIKDYQISPSLKFDNLCMRECHLFNNTRAGDTLLQSEVIDGLIHVTMQLSVKTTQLLSP